MINNNTNENNNSQNKIKLVSGYSKSIENLTLEINDTNEGDEIQLSVYVFEYGKSTEKVIESLSNACNRGVSVHRESRWFHGVKVHQVVTSDQRL